MKRIILGIFFVVFFAIASLAQTYAPQQQQQQPWAPHPEQIMLTNITFNQVQNGWARHGNSCAGCPSYWYQVWVTQTQHRAEDGNLYFYYYFKFFSNSYYGNGNPAGTYLSQINYSMNGSFVISQQYLLVPQGQMVWGAWMRSYYNNATVAFTVTQMSVY